MARNRDGTLQNPQAFLNSCLSNPATMAQLPPNLRDAVSSGDIDSVQGVFRQFQREAEQRQMEAQLIRPGEDPMDLEVQARIAEYIRQKNVEENFEAAMEFNPEVFAQVTMLYVTMDVNGNKMAAFIDSGAQSTIMSAKSAEQCNLLRLMDTRYQGIAKGVGTSKILGRAPLKVGSQHVSASITILEDDSMPFLFGLDMLRRYQCSIDLHKNVLRFGSISNAELPFLAEHELPAKLRRESSDVAAEGVGKGSAPGPATLPNGSGAPGGVTTVLNPTPASAPQRAAAAVAAAKAAGAASPSGTAQPSSTAPSASAQPTASNPAGNIQGEAVQRLMGLGFGKQECQQALQMCNGNEDQAASFLFESSMGG
ncbi:TPA: DNA damage-inducible protein 1 [Trebouxia sp. C0004]